MAPYIFTARNGVHIIDLVQTAQLMEEAYVYMRTAAEQGKRFLSSSFSFFVVGQTEGSSLRKPEHRPNLLFQFESERHTQQSSDRR